MKHRRIIRIVHDQTFSYIEIVRYVDNMWVETRKRVYMNVLLRSQRRMLMAVMSAQMANKFYTTGHQHPQLYTTYINEHIYRRNFAVCYRICRV